MKFASAALLSLLLTQSAVAATRHWTGAKSELWSDPLNWSDGAPAAGDDLVFDLRDHMAMTNDYPDGTYFNSLTFSAYGAIFTLRGNRITLGPGGWTQRDGVSVVALASISLACSQTWQISFGPAGSGLILGNGSTTPVIDLGPNILTLTGGGAHELSAIISGTGGLTVLDAGLAVTLRAQLNYTGPTTIGADGGLEFHTPDSAPVMTPIVVNDGGSFSSDGASLNASLTLNRGSTFRAHLNSLPAGQYPLTVKNGAITLAGNLNSEWTLKPPGTVFTIIHNETGNPIRGTFEGLPEGAIFKPYEEYTGFRISYLGGSGHDVTLTVVATPTVTTLASSHASSTSGESVTFTATVSPAATGSVTFFDCGVPVAIVPLDGSSRASLTTGSLSCGSHNITARYLGTSSLAPSTSSILVQQVLINTAIPALDPKVLAALAALLIGVATIQLKR